MRCLTSVLIEDYAEGLLSRPEVEAVEVHLRGCAACRRELAERKRWLDACRSLPPLKPPPGFTKRVVNAAFPEVRRQSRRVFVLAGGLASLALTLAVLILTGVCDVPDMMARSGTLLWRGLQTGASICVKGVRLFLALLKVASEVMESLGRGVKTLSGASSPQLQILAAVMILILLTLSFFGYRKLVQRR